MPILINEIVADIEPELDGKDDASGLKDIMPLEKDEYETFAALDVIRQRYQRLMVD